MKSTVKRGVTRTFDDLLLEPLTDAKPPTPSSWCEPRRSIKSETNYTHHHVGNLCSIPCLSPRCGKDCLEGLCRSWPCRFWLSIRRWCEFLDAPNDRRRCIFDNISRLTLLFLSPPRSSSTNQRPTSTTSSKLPFSPQLPSQWTPPVVMPTTSA